jgi:uncharacterized protein (DUF983 family)
MFKGTKLFSVVTGKCPRCQEGDLFINKNPYKLKNWDGMHEHCSNCDLKFELEPGFFQGAMYVSYGLGVAQSVAVFLVFWVIIGFDPLWFFIVNTVGLFLMAPVLFRVARAAYLNIFIKYEKKVQ